MFPLMEAGVVPVSSARASPLAALHDPVEVPAKSEKPSVPELPSTLPVLVNAVDTVVEFVPAVFSNVPALLNVPPPVVTLSVG